MREEKTVAVITGASGNLGHAVARAFQASGANTVLVDRSADRLEAVFPDLVSSSDHLLAGGVDLLDSASVQEVIQRSVKRFSRLDTLFNSVGAYQGGKPLVKSAPSVFDSMLKVNLLTTVTAVQAVLPQMIEQRGGCVINTSSRSGFRGVAGEAAYSAAKAGVLRLTESLAEETKALGIRVNCIVPGTMDTPQNRRAIPDADFGAWVAPDAIANVVLFLASRAAQAITGAALPVFGRS